MLPLHGEGRFTQRFYLIFFPSLLSLGEIVTGEDPVTLNEDRVKRELNVTSICDRPIQVKS